MDGIGDSLDDPVGVPRSTDTGPAAGLDVEGEGADSNSLMQYRASKLAPGATASAMYAKSAERPPL